MDIFSKKIIDDVKSEISMAKKIVITAHLNPDGDALGSSLALYNYLKSSKECKIVLPNNIPDTFKWMPGCGDILIWGSDGAGAKVHVREENNPDHQLRSRNAC